MIIYMQVILIIYKKGGMKMKAPAKKPMSLSIPLKLHKRIKNIAQNEVLSVTTICILALSEYAEKYENSNVKTVQEKEV